MSGLPLYEEATGKMIPCEPREALFSEENFSSQSSLKIESLGKYLELRAQYIGKSRGETIIVPAVLQNKAARKAVEQPVQLYTPESFPTYELLEQHGTPELTRNRYNSLRAYYLGQPIPQQETSAGDDRFMKKGMTWGEAYIAAAMSYE
jgi:hypothetical protein